MPKNTSRNELLPATLAARLGADANYPSNGNGAPSTTGVNGKPSTTGVNGGPSTTGVNGRDKTGRFTKGNRCATGNPFSRRVAALRSELLQTVTEEDIKRLAKQLLEQAKSGDLAAVKLLFLYTVGRPGDPVDPDKLDVSEWDLWRRGAPEMDDLEGIINGVPLEVVLKTVQLLTPFLVQNMSQQIVARFGEEAGAKQAEAGHGGLTPRRSPGDGASARR